MKGTKNLCNKIVIDTETKMRKAALFWTQGSEKIDD
jgi:hypothetical protein